MSLPKPAINGDPVEGSDSQVSPYTEAMARARTRLAAWLPFASCRAMYLAFPQLHREKEGINLDFP